MQILDTKIGLSNKPFIIADMSGNHNQSLDHALSIVYAASEAGVDAIKLQTYAADTITLNVKSKDFPICDKESLWSKEYVYDFYSKTHTPWEWHKPIIDLAQGLGLIYFSSPFDSSEVDSLEELNVPAYKIESFENNHLPLIKKILKLKKPVIISSGFSSLANLDEVYLTAQKFKAKNFAFLKCTSTYPANPKDSNLKTIKHIRNLFNCEVGLSDHTQSIGTSLIAIAFGATILEKRLTLSRKKGGVDSAFSLEPKEMKQLVIESIRAWKSIGNIKYGPTKKEKKSLKFRRQIYVSKDINKADNILVKNVSTTGSGYGIQPKYF